MEFARKADLSWIHKGELSQKTQESGYRPIALLPCEGKEMGQLVILRLECFMFTYKNCEFSDYQYGFVKGRTTNMAIQRMLEWVFEKWDAQSQDKQKIAAVLSLDFSKAYDRV